MTRRARYLLLATIALNAGLLGCEREALQPVPPAPHAPRLTQASPPEARTVHTLLVLTQRELGSPDAVVVERRTRCRVERSRQPARLRLIQAEPEECRIRRGAAPWQELSLEDATRARPLPAEGILNAWLPAARVAPGDRQTRLAVLSLAGQPIDLLHSTEVVREPAGLRLTMHARGERRWPKTGVLVTVVGEGSALLLDERAQWPERIEFTYRTLATGGPGADAESSVRFVLSLDGEPRS